MRKPGSPFAPDSLPYRFATGQRLFQALASPLHPRLANIFPEVSMLRSAFAVTALLVLQAVCGSAQTGLLSGAPPQANLGARDLFSEFKLPPLADHGGDRLWEDMHALQVFDRTRLLKLDDHSAIAAWTAAEVTYRRAHEIVASLPTPARTEFNGTSASALNVLLAHDNAAVHVSSPELLVDTPIRVTGTGVDLDLGTAKLRLAPDPATKDPYLVRIEAAQDVHLSGGELLAGNWGVLVSASHNVTVTGVDVHDLSGGGIAVINSEDVILWKNRLHRLQATGILLNGDTQRATVFENDIFRNLGSLNWNAGILLSDRNVDIPANSTDLFATPHFWQPMVERLHSPHDNLIVGNRIAENASSGLYSDGSTRNIMVGNRIESNSKEGLCLDNGSAADVVAWNLFRANGQRWGKSDGELKNDGVLQLGRLPDGTSPAKLPGVSLDNAAFNQIAFNQIDGNYGGGIKMVRTSLYNLVGMNLLTNDNEGRSKVFHFFGIELGAAKVDFASVEMNFTGSSGNEIFGNTIRGPHYAGIFFAEGSERNNIFDNSIFGATNWAMESVKVQPDTTLNNLTNIHSRNIDAGLDGNLFKLSSGIIDAPPPPPPPAHPPAATPK